MKNRKNTKLNKKFVQSPNIQKLRHNTKSADFPSAQFHRNKRGLRASGLSLLPLALRPLLFLPIFLSIFIFQTANVSAKSVTLTIPSEPLTLKVTPGQGSVFKKSSAGTIRVATDSSYGYSLSIQSKTSNDLLNGSNKIASIVSALSESDYENSGDTNTWAYLPSKLGSSVNTDFQPGPTTEPTTLDRIETSSEGTDYGLTLAAKIDDTLPAGNYSNTFVLSATSNDPPYDDIIQNWADCDTLESEQTINLLDVRDNKIYSVAKLKDGQCWMTENLAIGKEDSEMTLTSDTSDTASDFTLPASSTSGFSSHDVSNVYVDNTYGGYYTWYAATAGEGTRNKSSGNTAHSICPKGWRLPTKAEFDSLVSAQGAAKMTQSPADFKLGGFYGNGSPYSQTSNGYYWSSTAYAANYAYSLNVASGNAYTDGYGKDSGYSVRCVSRPDNPKKVGTMQTVDEWGDSVEEGKTVISEDVRDNKQYTVARLADGRLWMTKNLEIGKEDSEMTLTSDTSDTTSDFTLLASSDIPNSNNVLDSREIHLDSTYGGYYTWYTATAGEGTRNIPSDGQNVEHSICPKGWRLPTKDEYVALTNAYGIGDNSAGATTLQGDPFNFKLGGFYANGSPRAVDSQANYWSSTAYGSVNAHSLVFYSSNVYSQSNFGKSYLISVRCVSRTDDPKEVGTMQTVDEWGDSVKQGKTVISEDVRDNKQYTAARLADGRLWMTKNLEIENYNLTSTDSDVASNFQIPASTNNPNSSNAYDSRELHVDNTYGGYYTWYTATAGEGTQRKSSGDVSHSICPKGWRLPTSAEFLALNNALGGNTSSAGVTKLQAEPQNFKMGGLYSSGSPGAVGSQASYWSSSAYPSNSSRAYNLRFGSSVVYPQADNNKYDLMSVRCVSRE